MHSFRACASFDDLFIRRERDWVLGEFKAGRSPILIATDVASRGLGKKFVVLLLWRVGLLRRLHDSSVRSMLKFLCH